MGRAAFWRLVGGFTVAFAMLAGIGVLGYQQNAALVRDANLVSHTHQVIARLASLGGATDVAASSVRFAAITRDPADVAAARAVIARVDPALADLRTLVDDNPDQLVQVDRLTQLLRAQAGNYETALRDADPRAMQPAQQAQIDTLVRTMEQTERQLLETRTAQSLVSVQRTQILIAAGSMLGLLIGLVTALIAIRALRGRDAALQSLAALNAQLDARVREQTAALQVANDQLTALSHQLLAGQEGERRAVAHALHEAIGQEIAALQLSLQVVDDTTSDAGSRAQIANAIATIDRILDEIRTLSTDLRPAALDDFGLVAALRSSVAQLASERQIALTFDAALRSRPPLPVETACFRIAQDALALLLAAPELQTLRVWLTDRDDQLELLVCGHSTSRPDLTRWVLTLLTLRERAAAAGGTLAVESATPGETRIVVRFPATHQRAA